MFKDTSLHPSPQLVLVEQQGVVVALSMKQVLSLFKKSEQSGISFDTLKEVYQRGYAQSLSEQIAYNRVNSFIAGGAAMEIDEDLAEAIKGPYKPKTVSSKDVADAANRGDKALDKTYGYGTTKGGVSPIAGFRRQQGFGAMANFNSAQSAINSKRRGENPRDQDSAVHRGWGKTVDQMKAPNPEKQTSREKLKKTAFSDLPKDEQEKDTVLRKAVLKNSFIAGGVSSQTEDYTGAEKVSKNSNDPSSRFVATNSLTDVLKKDTPGYSKTIKRVVKEHCGCKKEMEEDAKGEKMELLINR